MNRVDLDRCQTQERTKRLNLITCIPIAKRVTTFAKIGVTEGMRGIRFGSARGVTALWRRASADRGQFWRQRRRAVLHYRPQRRRQDLDRQLHLGPLPADRGDVVL